MLSYIPALILFLVVGAFFLARSLFLGMPGRSFKGSPPPLAPHELEIRRQLEGYLREISHTIGERNFSRKPREMMRCAGYIEEELEKFGYEISRQDFKIANDRTAYNLEVTIPGSNDNLSPLVLGAHYDTVPFSPGANDNGSAVAALLVLAQRLHKKKPLRTIRLVFFANEESPYFMTNEMGALNYANQCRARGDDLWGMICLETIGYFTKEANSQTYPWPLKYFCPSRGDFLAFVGNTASRSFVKTTVGAFRHKTLFPSFGVSLPNFFHDASRSDHNAFWKNGYHALIITDTANFRYPYYHTADDTLDKIDLDSLARITTGLEETIEYMATRNF